MLPVSNVFNPFTALTPAPPAQPVSQYGLTSFISNPQGEDTYNPVPTTPPHANRSSEERPTPRGQQKRNQTKDQLDDQVGALSRKLMAKNRRSHVKRGTELGKLMNQALRNRIEELRDCQRTIDSVEKILSTCNKETKMDKRELARTLSLQLMIAAVVSAFGWAFPLKKLICAVRYCSTRSENQPSDTRVRTHETIPLRVSIP